MFLFYLVQLSMQWTGQQSEKLVPAHQLLSGPCGKTVALKTPLSLFVLAIYKDYSNVALHLLPEA